jgi:transcription initiation factor TFIID TATA-box-binding protein
MLVQEQIIKTLEIEANIRNIVVLYKTKVSDLEYLSETLGGIYEPEQFPAIIYKPDEIDVTYLIFNSGKIIISGIKSIKQIQ